MTNETVPTAPSPSILDDLAALAENPWLPLWTKERLHDIRTHVAALVEACGPFDLGYTETRPLGYAGSAFVSLRRRGVDFNKLSLALRPFKEAKP